jgi:hypothetical protein
LPSSPTSQDHSFFQEKKHADGYNNCLSTQQLKVGDGVIAKYFIIDIHIVASNCDEGRNKIKQTAKRTT